MFTYLPEIETSQFPKVPAAILEDDVTRAEHLLKTEKPLSIYTSLYPGLDQMINSGGYRKAAALQIIFKLHRMILDEIYQRRDSGEPSDKPGQLYREFNQMLRYASQMTGPYQRECLAMLKELQLETQLPFNELETPHWLDSYTSEEDGRMPLLEEIIPEKRDIGGDPYMALAEAILDYSEWEDQHDMDMSAAANIRSARPAPSSPWTRYVTKRKPYTEKPRPIFVRLSGIGNFDIEWVNDKAYAYQNGERIRDNQVLTRIGKSISLKGDEKGDELFAVANNELYDLYDPEDYKWDDRGYVPPTIEGLSELQTTQDLGDLYRAAQPYTDGIRSIVKSLQDEARHFERTITAGEISYVIRHCKERADLLQLLSDKAHEGYAPQDLMMVFLSVQNAFMLREEDAMYVSIPVRGTLLDFMDMFGDEVLENNNSKGLRRLKEVEDEHLKTADYFLQEILSTYPIVDDKVEKTALWNECYIRAVIDGAPISGGEGVVTAYDLAWAGWRSATSSAGASAFNKTFAETENYSAAWRQFYQAGRAAKEIVDYVVQMKPSGLVITPSCSTERREINWGLAGFKLKQGELSIDGIRDQMIEALRNKGWAPGFLAQLESGA